MSGLTTLGEAALGLVLLLGIFQSGCSLRFEVKDESNKTCILADLSVYFTVDYKMADTKTGKSNFTLPNTAVLDNSSSCGVKNGSAVPLLAIVFDSGNVLSMNFTKTDTDYKVDQLMFTYNLSNPVLFPGSTENGTKQVASSNTEMSAHTNKYYQCSNPHLIRMGNANVTFHNVKLEAYLNGNNYSKDVDVCKEDVTPTVTPTVAPTTPPVNPKTPDTGNYRVNGTSGAACILAKMGLQLNITYKKKDGKEASFRFNIDPKLVTVSGSCSNTSALLRLSSDNLALLFTFTLNTTANKFYLGRVSLNTSVPDAAEPNFVVDSGSLSFLETATHKSYKCNTKETLKITDKFSMDTYSLHVQAFDVEENKFGPAVECADDQNGMLVPIVVGAALAGLVLIVLIAYLIGRKRSHAGYQTI
ncbi:lysosome-associated membrane glycoprotein 1 [Eleutherodactylus coqui]|uniref:lysosome-associated membrane glycoprotein 1 n=1 Tax=Eleutherodactylus coqui TaxID=57060 RepID=UPI00346204CB